MNIKRFISTKCIGYNHDFSEVYFEHEVLLENGERKVAYNSHKTQEDGTISSNFISAYKPVIIRNTEGKIS